MDAWPLWVQWVVLIVLAGVILGGMWSEASKRSESPTAAPRSRREVARAMPRHMGVGDWATVLLLAVLLVPLMVRTFSSAP